MDARSPTIPSNTDESFSSSSYILNYFYANTVPLTDSAEDITIALKAASESQASIINVLNHFSKIVNVCVLGCQGDENPIYARRVAALINQKVGEFPELKPTVFVILGDNFYPDGVPSPNHERFEKQFHEIYGNPELTHICGIPCIVILGNHDVMLSTETHIKSSIPGHNYIPWLHTNPVGHDKAGLQQIAHSMMSHPSDPVKLCKPEFYKQKSVQYQELPKHLMPHYFHYWIFDNLQIFALNSNTYVKDYLNYLRDFAFDKPIDPMTNQAVLTQVLYTEAKECGRSIMLTKHHPSFSLGKRRYESGWDAKHYLEPIEITLINLILQLSPDAPDFKENLKAIFTASYENVKLTSNADYNEMLRKIIYTFQKMSPDLDCAAHDHSNYYYNNTNVFKRVLALKAEPTLEDINPCTLVTLLEDHMLTVYWLDNNKIMNKSYPVRMCLDIINMLPSINTHSINGKLIAAITSVYNCQPSGPKIRQIGAGAGGSTELQHQFYFGQDELVGGYLRQHGFSIISHDKTNPGIFLINTFTTKGQHLRFTNQSSTPQRMPETDNNVRLIRDIVLSACRKYMIFLDARQAEIDGEFFRPLPTNKVYKNLFSISGIYSAVTSHKYNMIHTHADVDIMHDMINYLNQPIPTSYLDTIKFLHTCMDKLYNKESDHSLYMDINEQLQKTFEGKSMTLLYEEVFSLGYAL